MRVAPVAVVLLLATTGCHGKSHDKSEPGALGTATSALGSDGGGAFGAECKADSECTSGVCFVGKQASYCSTKCSKDSDCPSPPGTGTCSKRGYCKNKP